MLCFQLKRKLKDFVFAYQLQKQPYAVIKGKRYTSLKGLYLHPFI